MVEAGFTLLISQCQAAASTAHSTWCCSSACNGACSTIANSTMRRLIAAHSNTILT